MWWNIEKKMLYCYRCHVKLNKETDVTVVDFRKTIIQQYSDRYTGRWWVDCYIWYSEEQPRRAEAAPSPLLTVPNVTANPPTASILTSCGTVTLLCTLRVKREKEIDVTVDGLQRVNLLWLKVSIAPLAKTRALNKITAAHAQSDLRF